MLRNLIKYDLKWIYKAVGVFYIMSLFFAIVGRCFSTINNSMLFNVLSQISFGITISMMVSSLINCLMRSWSRFYRNNFKDESYLTQTLPIKKEILYTSKIISTIICTITTICIIIICLFICYYSKENLNTLKSMLELAASTYNTTIINLLLAIFLVFFLEIVFVMLIGINGLIIGHKYNDQKLLKSIIIGFILYIVTQAIIVIIIIICGLFNPAIMNLINTTSAINIDTIKLIMYIAIAIYTSFNIIYYFLGRKLFTKGFDIE